MDWGGLGRTEHFQSCCTDGANGDFGAGGGMILPSPLSPARPTELPPEVFGLGLASHCEATRGTA